MDIKKRAFILAFSGIILSVLAYLLLILSRRYKLVIYLAGLFTSDIVKLLEIGATICFWLFLHMILKYLGARYLKFTVITRVGSFIVTATAVGFCIIMIFFGLLKETDRFILRSPDQEHTIVVTESSFLLYGGGDFYEKVNQLFVVPIGGFTADDGYRPFKDGEYTVEWFNDGLRIKYLANPPDIYEEKRLYYLEEKLDAYIEGSRD